MGTVTGQQARPLKEQQLPGYALDILDQARAGYGMFGNKLNRDDAIAVFASWGLPPPESSA